MNTNLESLDALVTEAKAVSSHGIPLPAMVEHSSPGGIDVAEADGNAGHGFIAVNHFGFPVLKRSPGGLVSSEQVCALAEDEDA